LQAKGNNYALPRPLRRKYIFKPSKYSYTTEIGVMARYRIRRLETSDVSPPKLKMVENIYENRSPMEQQYDNEYKVLSKQHTTSSQQMVF
jgi:hypothetical protein